MTLFFPEGLACPAERPHIHTKAGHWWRGRSLARHHARHIWKVNRIPDLLTLALALALALTPTLTSAAPVSPRACCTTHDQVLLNLRDSLEFSSSITCKVGKPVDTFDRARVRARASVRASVRVRVWIRVRARVSLRAVAWVRVRVSVEVRVRVSVSVRVRVCVMVRVRVMTRVLI